MQQRLSKRLATAGVASRRACEKIIQDGRVAVNGETVLIPQTGVTDSDVILVDGKPLLSRAGLVYYVLHKPSGMLCSHVRRPGEQLIYDLFPQNSGLRLFSVGRLDKETTGLLLVTNDGHFAQRIIHPSAGLSKDYVATLWGDVASAQLVALQAGMELEGSWVRPLFVKRKAPREIHVVIAEGKKREVRLLLAHVGLEVLHLSRVRLGGLHLGALPMGQWRLLTEEEREITLFEEPFPQGQKLRSLSGYDRDK